MTDKKRLVVEIDQTHYDALKDIAWRRRQTVSDVVRELIAECVLRSSLTLIPLTIEED